MNCNSSRAFTLVELLMVIAIIAILAAILFPVFAQAKTAAKKAVSLNNLKQLATANLLYAGDNDDALPRTMDTASGFPQTISWWAANNYQIALEPYIRSGRGGVESGGQTRGKGSVWFDPMDPDANVPAMWGSYANNGFLTGMHRVLSTVAEPSNTIYSGLRIGQWQRAVGVMVPSPLPVNNPTHPFWASEFFDICFDLWDVDASAANSPYHFSTGRAAPPCSHFPQDPRCQNWNGQLDGEWSELLHGMPMRRMGQTRYGTVQLFNFVDGHARAMPFSATYRSSSDNLWSVTR